MSWFRVDDTFPSHPKVLKAGPDAAWLYICGGCYCAKHLTDGLIPKVAVPTLSTLRSAIKLAERLLDVGLWAELDEDYEMHDYLVYNPSREHVLTERHNKSMAGAKGAAARWQKKVDAPIPSHPEVPTEPLEGAASGTPRKRGSRIPDRFEVSPEMEGWAKSQAPDVDWVMETRKFVNYWKAKPGKDAVKLDWERTWQNWLFNAQGRTNGRGAVRTHL